MPPYQSSNAPPQARYPPPTVPTPSYHSTGYVLPQPAVTGNVDLSNVRPVGSGTVSIADSIAQARAFAAEKGVASYDRPLIYASANGRPGDAHHHPSRSRSRSPQGRRDGGGYRDNPYRDERRGRGAGDDRGGRREYRDRSYSSGPRDRDRDARSQNRGRPGAGGLDDNSEIIPIESSLVGLIIGRQGENLRRIEAESACRVQFLPPSTEQTSFRQCKISGPPLQRSQVKDAINKIIDDNGMGALNRQVDRTGRAGPELRDGEDHVKMSVPDRTVGLIIGRGGETIRDLQEKSGCHINIVDEKQSINGLRPVNLIGTPEAARMARMLILQIVETDNQSHDPSRGDPGNPNGDLGYASQPAESAIGPVSGGEKTNDKIYVPSDTVGMIIGKGGETIRDIQQQTGCKINVMQAALGAAPDSQREINLIGSRDSIERAKAAIFEKVDVAVSGNTAAPDEPACPLAFTDSRTFSTTEATQWSRRRRRRRFWQYPDYGKCRSRSPPKPPLQQQ